MWRWCSLAGKQAPASLGLPCVSWPASGLRCSRARVHCTVHVHTTSPGHCIAVFVCGTGMVTGASGAMTVALRLEGVCQLQLASALLTLLKWFW
jgi:hypothetical protein